MGYCECSSVVLVTKDTAGAEGLSSEAVSGAREHAEHLSVFALRIVQLAGSWVSQRSNK